MPEPIPFKVTRYRCPHCPRTASRPIRIREHMTRCWLNPAAKGCKTCKHFEPYGPENADGCKVGVDLTGRPECKTCGGIGEVFDRGDFGVSECAECGGDGHEIKPGPIVGCASWEPS